MAASSEASAPSAGTRPCRSRAIASIISIRKIAKASGVSSGAAQISAAPDRITAMTTRALRIVLETGLSSAMAGLSPRPR